VVKAGKFDGVHQIARALSFGVSDSLTARPSL
jgi:hypothetical protein